MSDRDYNKLFLQTNRSEGSEKLLLGYQHDSKETVLYKDAETYFHVPLYTSLVSLSSSSLIVEGAIGGSFPAAADRIFKSQKNYGKSTPNGNPKGIVDGTWFCSWLYKDARGRLRWMDRFYNPGTLKFSVAIDQLNEGPEYVPNNPVFRDVPSRMVFEPGVLYYYYHVGEKTAQQLVTTFGGVNSDRILIDIEDWSTTKPNSAPNTETSIQPDIRTSGITSSLFAVNEEEGRVSGPVLSFDNNDDVSVRLPFSENYNPTNEFSLTFWANSPSWNDSQATQLIGNYSYGGGGFGLFLETLSSYPFFVIPETNYGHLLYINEESVGFLDKSLHSYSENNANEPDYVERAPELVCVDTDNNVILCNSDNTGTIYKLDHTGELVGSSKQRNPNFSFSQEEIPHELFCGQNNSIYVRTNINLYEFDSNFFLKQKLPFPYSLSAVSTFRYKSNENFYELHTDAGSYDCKFIQTTKWRTSVTTGHLYKTPEGGNEELFYRFNDVATSFAVDPSNRLWVCHGTNKISIFDSSAAALTDPLFTTTAGLDIEHSQKNITFACYYDRSTSTREWRCLIYYPEDFNLYILDINGNLIDTINIKSLFDLEGATELDQNPERFRFKGKGDFTGYEHRRIFHSIYPYNNSSQLVVKASLRDRTESDLTYVDIKAQVPINWDKNVWQHIAIILKNKTFSLYSNSKLQTSLSYSGRYELSYGGQPDMYIGVPVGSQRGFNTEINYPSLIFNGYIQNLKMYDYPMSPGNLETFIKAAWKANNMSWPLPTPSIQYMERIERMFQNKLPGSKSSMYRINLRGTNIKDQQTREIIENQLKVLISSLQPAHVDFLQIHWVD